MSIHLSGGGWPSEDDAVIYREFLNDVASYAQSAGRIDGLRVAIVLVRDGDGPERGSEVQSLLSSITKVDPVVIIAAEGSPIAPTSFADIDGVLVFDGLAPAYRESLEPSFLELRRLVAAGMPYLGLGAGAVLAGDTAIVGGWKIGSVPVSPYEAAQEIEQVTIAEGLGLVDLGIDIQAAQQGTLSRTIAACEAGMVDGAVAIDAHTSLIIRGGALAVVGRGSVWRISNDNGTVRVASLGASDE